jgi:anaerobic magnesium-protoporphyrin IX monomethyl ester cyclase
MSHVTLIRGPWVSYLYKVDTDGGSTGSPPLGVAYLAAVLKGAGHQVCVIDAFGEAPDHVRRVPEQPLNVIGLSIDALINRVPRDTDLIGFSVMFSGDWLVHKRVARAVHEAFPAVPIIIGGEHASAEAAYILRHEPHVRACVRGEGEETVLELLEAMACGRDWREVAGLCVRDPDTGAPVATPSRKRKRALDELPWPAWDEIPLEAYFAKGGGFGSIRGRTMPLLASRGCPYACTFCSNPDMWGRYWNVRDPGDVVAEIKHYVDRYGIDSVSFYDSTTIVRRDWILRFTDLLMRERLGVEWSMPSGTRSEALDDEVLSALKRSGCPKISYAPESGSVKTLARIDKHVDLDRMIGSIRAAVRRGLIVKAHIIMGFPFETLRGIWQDYVLIVRLAWAGVSDLPVYVFNPYPGSALHDEIRRRGGFPAEGEPYEEFLASSYTTSFWGVRSWSEHISSRQLHALIWGGMALFYTCQFAFRPWRLLVSLYRLATSRPMTMYERLPEMMMQKVLRQLRMPRRGARRQLRLAAAPEK